MNTTLRIALTAIGLQTAASQVAAEVVSSQAMPVIELVGTNEVELGQITCEELKLVTFRFRNPGNVPVEIKRITSTCHCLRGYPEQVTIPPKGEINLTAELNPLNEKKFQRGLWIHTSDPKMPMILLVVSGEVVPLFEGFPQETLQFKRCEPGEVWTNVLNLTAVITNLSLGTPVITASKDLRVTASVRTNQTRAGSFNLTLLATPLVSGRSSAAVEIPIDGKPNLPHLKLKIQARVGTKLYVSPSKFLMVPSDQPLKRSYFVRTAETTTDLDLVTFSPQREGVTCEVLPATHARRTGFTLHVTVTPEALAKLMREQEPKLSIGYPNYKAAEIAFIP